MARAGIIAFPVILVLGGITGYLAYDRFTDATPDPGIVQSPYWKPLSASPPPKPPETGTNKTFDESKYSEVVTINILAGATAQGSPDYDPDPATAGSGALVKWVNLDSTLHTATSGTGQSDLESGKLFDTGYLSPGGKFSIPAADIGTGEHKYYCQLHPYMTSAITIQ